MRRIVLLGWLFPAVLLFGCKDSDGSSQSSDNDGAADKDTSSDPDTDADTGSGTDGDTDPDGDTGTDTDIIPDDRRVVWEGNVGIPGGIPSRTTICATIDAGTFGNGTADATSAIQSALDDCPTDEVVFLPAGTYKVTDKIEIWSHKVLRGAGPDETVISYEGPPEGRSALAMAGWPNFDDGSSVAVASGAVKGATTITVADAELAAVGDIMLIDQLNDGEFVDPNGVEGMCTYCGRAGGTRTLGQLVEVTQINGNEISFDIPLYWSFDQALSIEATFAESRVFVRWSGIEDLTLTQPEVSVAYLIEMQANQFCWLQNVEVERVDWRAVWMLQSLQSEIRDSYFHESINGYGRSHGYGVLVDMFSSANLVENNIFRTLDGGFMMTSGGAAGNVFAYNYTEDSRFDDLWWLTSSPSINHAPHPMMNLWEGNVGYQASGDFIHGSSSHNTIYRSVSRGWQQEATTANNNAISFATKNVFMNVVGCVLGTEGISDRYQVLPGEPYSNTEVVIWALGIMHGVDDANVAATLLRHGNYDYVNNDTVWDSSIPGHTMPPSLYLPTRPDWFGDVVWPPIGPDVPGRVEKIPAQLRYETMADP